MGSLSRLRAFPSPTGGTPPLASTRANPGETNCGVVGGCQSPVVVSVPTKAARERESNQSQEREREENPIYLEKERIPTEGSANARRSGEGKRKEIHSGENYSNGRYPAEYISRGNWPRGGGRGFARAPTLPNDSVTGIDFDNANKRLSVDSHTALYTWLGSPPRTFGFGLPHTCTVLHYYTHARAYVSSSTSYNITHTEESKRTTTRVVCVFCTYIRVVLLLQAAGGGWICRRRRSFESFGSYSHKHVRTADHGGRVLVQGEDCDLLLASLLIRTQWLSEK